MLLVLSVLVVVLVNAPLEPATHVPVSLPQLHKLHAGIPAVTGILYVKLVLLFDKTQYSVR